MKFDIHKKNFNYVMGFVLIIVSMFSVTNSFRMNKLSNTFRDEPINIFVNRGWSYLVNDQDTYKDVEKIVTKKNIFNTDIDVAKKFYDDFYISEENFRSAMNRNISNFDTEEMKKNSQTTIKGDYQVTLDSFVSKSANSHIYRKAKMSHLFTDTVGSLSLTMNHNKNFPNFHPKLVRDAYKTFFMLPNHNSPNHTQLDLVNDKDTIKGAIQFFAEYGTHYITEAMFGYRFGFHQEYRNRTTVLRDKKGNSPIPNLLNASFIQITEDPAGNSTDNATAAVFTPNVAGNNTAPDVSQFYIGQCTIEKFFLKTETCNKNNPRLVRFDVNPIHYLFNPLNQIKRDFTANGKSIEKDEMTKIANNMEFLFQEIQLALNPNLYVVTKLESFKLSRSSAGNQECLQIQPRVLEKIYRSYKQTYRKYFYQQDLMIKDKHLPVLTFKNFGRLKKTYNLISNAEDSLYWCLTRTNNITPEELTSGKWLQKRFLTEVKFIIDHDVKSFKEAGYECNEVWSFTDKKTKTENRWHFCTRWTDSFINPTIITDVKFFEFNQTMAKCTGGVLSTYIDGKAYECDCDLNFNSISDEKKQGDTFFCLSRKVVLKEKPIYANQPKFTGPS